MVTAEDVKKMKVQVRAPGAATTLALPVSLADLIVLRVLNAG